jgi:hypothetical protein
MAFERSNIYVPNQGTPTYTASTPSSPSSPAPHTGQGAFGLVPGDISNPNPFGDLSSIYPNLGATNTQSSKNIMDELTGQLSPSTINNIRNHAASFGVTSGMPGSQFQGYQGLANLGLTTEKVQGQGLQDYLNAITGISKTQTVDPALQTEIATQNSVWNAAPDPAAAAKEQQSLFDKYLQSLQSPAGGTGGGAPWWQPPGEPTNLGPGSTLTGGVWHTPAGFGI